MKLTIQFILISIVSIVASTISGCNDKDDILFREVKMISPQSRSIEEPDSSLRLSFDNEDELLQAIDIDSDDGEISTFSVTNTTVKNPKFVSMMAQKPIALNDAKTITYYEALGYDTLVPNVKFAKLLNINGEMEVGSDVIKITPRGTYRYNKAFEKEFNALYSNNQNLVGSPIDSISNRINDHIVLYRTFQESSQSYGVLSNGDETEYSDSYFGDDDIEEKANMSLALTRSTYPEPDFNSFASFSADKKTWIGKFIQSIIGATKTHTINFSQKRRVRGSFYFYNYGVYAEIGVKGWTDKKNWIGWSKTACDELRVGWKHVVLKTTYPDNFKKSMQDIKSMAYVPPQYTEINGKRYNTATLIMPDYKPGLKDKILKQGVKALYDFLKSELKTASELEKIEAFLVATRTEVLFVAAPQDVVKYNTKYYCHVFNKQWMDFTIGWSNQGGFFFGNSGLNQNNVSQIGPWVNTVVSTFNQKKTKLVGGEVYVCARFGDIWKGMKIIKKAE